MPQQLDPGYYIELKIHSAIAPKTRYFAFIISSVDSKLLLRSNLLADSDFSYTVLADSSEKFTPFDGIVGNDVGPHPSLKNSKLKTFLN